MEAIGLDVGYGYTKAISRHTSLGFPSAVGPAEEAGFSPELIKAPRAPAGGAIEYSGGNYFYGNLALRHSRVLVVSLGRGWISSVPYRILMRVALGQAIEPEPPGRPLACVTGLAVSYHGQDMAQVKALLSEEIRSLGHSPAVVEIIPQPFGALFDLLLDESGRTKNEAEATGTFGVIDVGYYTTDFIRVQELESISKASTTVEVGLSTAIDALTAEVYRRHGRRLRREEAEGALQSKRVRARGKALELSPMVKPILRETAEAILAAGRRLWGEGEELDLVLTAGGGADLFWEEIRRAYPHARLADTAYLANARGFLKYAKRLARQS